MSVTNVWYTNNMRPLEILDDVVLTSHQKGWTDLLPM